MRVSYGPHRCRRRFPTAPRTAGTRDGPAARPGDCDTKTPRQLPGGGSQPVDAAHFGVGGLLLEEPLVRLTHAGVEVDLRLPPGRGKAADVEHLTRCAIGLGEVELQLG